MYYNVCISESQKTAMVGMMRKMWGPSSGPGSDEGRKGKELTAKAEALE